MRKTRKRAKEFNLGPLEKRIMDICWDKGPVTVKDIHVELLDKDGIKDSLAYTTIMTVMKRLADKGVLKVDTKKTAYVYTPKISRDEAAKKMLENVANIYGGDVGALAQAVGVL